MSPEEMRRAPLHYIVAGCAWEAERSRTEEHGYGWELFRRAFETEDEAAWTAVHDQYGQMLLLWLDQAGQATLSDSEIDDLYQQTIERFWGSVRRGRLPLADHFAHVGALLKYLRRCAGTAVYDWQRRRRRATRLAEALAGQAVVEPRPPAHEPTLEAIGAGERLQAIRRWVRGHVHDERERLVLRLSYEQGLTPRQIAAQHPGHFPSAGDVRRVKERVLRRARRALVTGSDD